MKYPGLLIFFLCCFSFAQAQSHYYPPSSDLEKSELTGPVKKVTHYQFYQQKEVPGLVEYYDRSGNYTYSQNLIDSTFHFYFYNTSPAKDTLKQLAMKYGPCYISVSKNEPGYIVDSTFLINMKGEQIDSSIHTAVKKLNEDGTFESVLFHYKYPGSFHFDMVCTYIYFKQQKKVIMTMTYPGGQMDGTAQTFYFSDLNRNPQKLLYAQQATSLTYYFEYNDHDHCIKETCEVNGEQKKITRYIYEYDAARNWTVKKTTTDKGAVYEYYKRVIEYY